MKSILILLFLGISSVVNAQFKVVVHSVSQVEGRLLVDVSLVGGVENTDAQSKEWVRKKEMMTKNLGEAHPGATYKKLKGQILAAYRLGEELLVRAELVPKGAGNRVGIITFHLDESKTESFLEELSALNPPPFSVHQTKSIPQEENVVPVQVETIAD